MFQLVYGLYPLMPTKYLLPTNNSYPNQDFFPSHILTSILMPPFDSSKVQTHSGFVSESNMHGSEEHNEGEKMDVDLVVALES